MAKKDKRKQIVYMIPEGETRDSHTYHYTAVKTKNLIVENRKLKLRKYNPIKRKHEMFVEAKLPKHQK
jgi:large subunit ribosomal protein L33